MLRYPNLYGGGERYRCKVRGFIFSLCPLRTPSGGCSVLKSLYLVMKGIPACIPVERHPYVCFTVAYSDSSSLNPQYSQKHLLLRCGKSPLGVGSHLVLVKIKSFVKMHPSALSKSVRDGNICFSYYLITQIKSDLIWICVCPIST